MKDQIYSTEDFLADESFQAFALGLDADAEQFWQQWLSERPAQQADFQEAVLLLQRLQAGPRPPAPAAIKRDELAKLWEVMREPARPQAQPLLRTRKRARRWALAALVAVLGLAIGLGWWHQATPITYATYATHPGEQRQLVLPDGSHVVLNADSKLTLAATWQPGQAREVWLTGDAYFSVEHTAAPALRSVPDAPANVKFVVHAGPLEVAVLGTQFTVFNHPDRTKVVLSSGQIELIRRTGRPEQLLLKPGELAEYRADAPSAPLVTRTVQAALYSAWTSGQLDFDNTSVADIVALLQDTYGLEITVGNPRLLQQKLSGSLPDHDLNGFLSAFGKLLNVKVLRKGNHVWLD